MENETKNCQMTVNQRLELNSNKKFPELSMSTHSYHAEVIHLQKVHLLQELTKSRDNFWKPCLETEISK